MTIRTIEVKCCDLCDTIEEGDIKLHAFKKVHICDKCFGELNLEYLRIYHKQVPSRRGGFRTLGEYDS